MSFCRLVLLSGISFIISHSVALADVDSAPDYRESFLSGDWGGKRLELSEKGLDFHFVYMGDAGRNFSGGQRIGNFFIENYDLQLSLDAEKRWGFSGLSFFVYFLGNNNSITAPPTSFVGDIQATDNIEAPVTDFGLYEFWVQQNFMEDKVSLLFGLHDLNSEFYALDSASVLLHPSFGIGFNLAQTGTNGSSVFPYTAPVLRAKWTPSEKNYVQGAIYGADAGEVGVRKGTKVNWSGSEGQLFIAEAGLTSSEGDPSFKYGIGAWQYNKKFERLDGAGEAINSGFYFLIDQAVSEDFSIFAHFGNANADISEVEANWTAGFLWKGAFTHGAEDALSLGIAQAQLGKGFRDVQAADGIETGSTETAIELTYRKFVGRGVFIQPDLQVVMDPNGNKALKDAWVGAVRLEVCF